jgi:hypothetical protein
MGVRLRRHHLSVTYSYHTSLVLLLYSSVKEEEEKKEKNDPVDPKKLMS